MPVVNEKSWSVVARDEHEASTMIVRVDAKDSDDAFRLAGKYLYDNESGCWSLLLAFPTPSECYFPCDTSNSECAIEDYPGVVDM